MSISINEIRIDQNGADSDEYFELFGTPGDSLANLTYLVIGDGAGGSGVIESVTDLSGSSLDSNGYFVAAEASFSLGSANLTTTLGFENSDNVTHLLVENFTGNSGDDLDTDDDGVLDLTPWLSIADAVALLETVGSGDQVYSPTAVGPNGSFVPAHIFRNPDGTGSFEIGDFTDLTNDTPGASNSGGSGGGPTAVAIAAIQGAGHTSPLVGQTVSTTGIVTAVASNGFYLQDPSGDGNTATSEGIFVFTGSAPSVSVGDEVEAAGSVSEFTPGGASTGNLSITQISASSTTVLSSGNPLPSATIVGAGGRIAPTQTIDDDNLTSFDPASDGIDFYESLEGMLLRVNNAVAVSPTSRFGEIAILPDNGAGADLRTPNGGIIIRPDDFNPERLILDDGLVADEPAVQVGDRFNAPIDGVLSYSFGNFKLLNPQPLPGVTPSSLTPETTTLTGASDQLTIASFNVENLDAGDPDEKFNAIASQIVANLQAPDILGLQEIQDNNGTTDDGTVAADQTFQKLIDAIAAAGGPTYEYRQIDPVNNADGGAPGSNIRVGYLFNPARVGFSDRGSAGPTDATAVNPNGVLSLSPGRVDPNNAAFADDGVDGGFEASRKSLAAEFTFNGQRIFVINNHFKSKRGDSPLFGATQPLDQETLAQRTAQAQVVNDLVDDLLAADPEAKIVALGDLNDFQFAEPVQTLAGGELTNLIDTLPADQRYTFNFDGNAQALDHILVSDSLAAGAEVDVVRVNSEFAAGDRASDHDPVLARLTLPTDMTYTLQILHAADQEGGLPAIQDAINFSAVMNRLDDDFANTLKLSSGDIYIPGPFFNASDEVYGEAGIGDILINNALGFQAVAFGNHEFDLGTETVRTLLEADPSITGPGIAGSYQGAQFPYLSANLDFSTDDNLDDLVVADGQAPQPNSIANSVVINVNGEDIGIVGATTPALSSISSPEDVGVLPANSTDFAALAGLIQTEVDELTATGIDKVVLLSHMQQIGIETQLASLLEDVDIIMAGGSNTLLANADDPLRAGDAAADAYPLDLTSSSGDRVVLINTDGNYKYVGRLAVEFDDNGLITSILDESGAYATDDAGVDRVYGSDVNPRNVADPTVVAVTDAIGNVVLSKDGTIFGSTEVFLNGTRGDVRTQETNLGNLTADANLFIAKQYDPSVVISLKNGGGIRDNIGVSRIPAGGTSDDLEQLPTAANPLVGKEAGDISQLDIENSLRFNNGLSLLTVTAAELQEIVEHAVSATAPGATPGQFPQVGGMSFSFDPDLPAGQRVQTLAIKDEDGDNLDVVITNGQLVGDPQRTFRMVTLGFLAGGGDGYPFDSLSNPNRVDLEGLPVPTGGVDVANFTDDGSEQDALAEYLAANFSNEPFSQADVPPGQDTRIQNLDFDLPPGVGTPPVVEKLTNNLFELNGAAGTALKLRLTLSQVGTGAVNEIGVFKVDDEQGSVAGQRPGSAGYTQAALARSRVVFSALPDTIFARFSSTRVIEFEAGDRLMFYLVQDGTTDEVLDGDIAAPTVLFANNGSALNASEIASGNFQLRWEDGLGSADFSDVVIQLEYAPNAAIPVGTRWQGENEREIIDLRDVGVRTASIEIRSEAAFANTVGLYAIDSPDGRIGNLSPGDLGYARAAVENLVTRFDRGGASPTGLQGLLAPVIFANTTVEEFLEENPDNFNGGGPIAYFPYIAANPDGVDHLRLLGDNLFGFEDLPGGGDFDYNDMVFQISFA